MKKSLRIALGAAAGLIFIFVIALTVLLNLDWNRAKPWLNARASEALGRTLIIEGDLSMTWEHAAGSMQGWHGMLPWPHFVARDIHLKNPPAMRGDENTPQDDTASIGQIDFSLNPWSLLSKNIDIPVLHLESPAIHLQRRKDGRNNWTFRQDDTPSLWQLKLHHIVFARGRIHLNDAVRQADVTANIDTLDADPIYGMKWQVHGQLDKETVSGNGRVGGVLSLQDEATPYPVDAHLKIGKTVISIGGVLTKPYDLAAVDMRLNVSGANLAHLYAISGIYFPETSAYSTSGHLIGTLSPKGSRWIYEAFSGRIGKSDIAGNMDYQSRQPRALLSGVVTSRVLHFSDLAPLIGADSDASHARRGAVARQSANKVLPVEPFKTERWLSVDANIKFSADRIVRNEALPINKLTTNIHLQDGVLSLTPLNFDMAGGNLAADITLDGSGKSGRNAIKARMKVAARHLQLKKLFPTLQPVQTSVGEINGDASLSAVGNSVSSLFAASNGEIKLLINRGTVSKLLLEEIGLNIGSVILSNLFGDKPVKLNCMVADLDVSNGVIQTRGFIIDTKDAILNVSGKINLAQEQLALTIIPVSRGLRVFSLRAPLYVRGSFKHPRVNADKGVLAMKTGGAIALATFAPFAALIPLINTGPDVGSDCARLLADARIKPVAPPPGKTYHPGAK